MWDLLVLPALVVIVMSAHEVPHEIFHLGNVSRGFSGLKALDRTKDRSFVRTETKVFPMVWHSSFDEHMRG